ncbi:hypothetical protein [Georgenia faecalis]|uniref:hypothetical protein n=1 Tax=Georgenia faecalis TaxID=2483799 RepID=UPI000FDA3F6C|nr:hypothetical protein [Georgenia faecalis]
MRDITPEALAALTGDRSRDRLLVTPWLDGAITWPGPLPVASWSIDWNRSRQIQGQVSLTVADEDGRLAPWMVDDVLGVGGPRLTCSLLIAGVGEEVMLGRYRITDAAPAQSWRSQRTVRGFDDQGLPVVTTEPPRWTSGGTVAVKADDETWGVQAADFLAPEVVVHQGSILAEIERLTDGIVTVSVADGVTDGTVPASVAYEGGRIDALGTLVRALGAQYRMTGDGQLHIFPATPGEPVWVIAPGEDGVLIDFARSYSAADFVNTVVVEGKSPDNKPLIGVAREMFGPLRTTGPHGLVPARRQSDILDTQAKVNQAAGTYLASAIRDRAIVLPVTCLPNPALEVGDVATLSTPVGDLTGPVETMRLSGGAAGVNAMELGITVSFEQVQVIGSRLRAAGQ